MSPFTQPLRARNPHESHRASTPLELFFDLVSVIAIASLTAAFHHAISEGHGPHLLPRFVFFFVAIWWAWMNYTWYASAFDNDDALHRFLTLLIMAGALVFAAGMGHLFETMDFSHGLVGWVVMRIGMIALWLRVAWHFPEYRRTASIYAIGIAIAQLLWCALSTGIAPDSAWFLPLGIGVFLVEFAVPVVAERSKQTPWHRHHIIERYGLLNIIVLGEVLLSISLTLGNLYKDHWDAALPAYAITALVIVFVLWWLYFLEPDHLREETLFRAISWGYGHVFVFLSAAALGAGIAANADVLAHHSKIEWAQATWYVAAPVAGYLISLWAIRDRFLPPSAHGIFLPLGAVCVVVSAWVGLGQIVIAAILVITLLFRLPRRQKAETKV